MQVAEFVTAQLPPPPARVLEVGCGEGALTLALADAGYDVTGIDPMAPPGPHFRRLLLEDLTPEDGPFDAVVAGRSLHHVADLELALDRICALLVPRGLLVLDEFVWDRLDLPTAEWYYGRLSSRPPTLDAFVADWHAEHVGLHGYAAIRAALQAHFDERLFRWTPYLHRLLDEPAEQEERLIAEGAIQATGFRYVGEARPVAGR